MVQSKRVIRSPFNLKLLLLPLSMQSLPTAPETMGQLPATKAANSKKAQTKQAIKKHNIQMTDITETPGVPSLDQITTMLATRIPAPPTVQPTPLLLPLPAPDAARPAIEPHTLQTSDDIMLIQHAVNSVISPVMPSQDTIENRGDIYPTKKGKVRKTPRWMRIFRAEEKMTEKDPANSTDLISLKQPANSHMRPSIAPENPIQVR